MRRCNTLFLVPLLAVVLAAVVSSTPPGASAHSVSSIITNFKGKIVAKNADDHYFVLSFTCSDGMLSAGWTYEVDSTQSFTGTLNTSAKPSCSLTSTNGVATWSQPSVDLFCVTCVPNSSLMVGTLTVDLTNIVATKTFFNVLVTLPPATTPTMLCTSSSSGRCLDVETSTPLSGPLNGVAGFSSQQCVPTSPCPNSAGFPYATLNLSGR